MRTSENICRALRTGAFPRPGKQTGDFFPPLEISGSRVRRDRHLLRSGAGCAGAGTAARTPQNRNQRPKRWLSGTQTYGRLSLSEEVANIRPKFTAVTGCGCWHTTLLTKVSRSRLKGRSLWIHGVEQRPRCCRPDEAVRWRHRRFILVFIADLVGRDVGEACREAGPAGGFVARAGQTAEIVADDAMIVTLQAHAAIAGPNLGGNDDVFSNEHRGYPSRRLMAPRQFSSVVATDDVVGGFQRP